jgi:hypothetical protein
MDIQQFLNLSEEQLAKVLSDWSFSELSQFCQSSSLINQKICQNPFFWAAKYFFDLGVKMPQIQPFSMIEYQKLYQKQQHRNRFDQLVEIYSSGPADLKNPITNIPDLDEILYTRLVQGWKAGKFSATGLEDYQNYLDDPQFLVNLIQKFAHYLPEKYKSLKYDQDTDILVLIALNELIRPFRLIFNAKNLHSH